MRGPKKKCPHCGKEFNNRHVMAVYCLKCMDWGKRHPLATKASSKVARAIKAGVLRPVTEFSCVDCGENAEHYDHRDYTKPLDVDPVCCSCNCRRGPAYPYNRAAARAKI